MVLVVVVVRDRSFAVSIVQEEVRSNLYALLRSDGLSVMLFHRKDVPSSLNFQCLLQPSRQSLSILKKRLLLEKKLDFR